MRPRKKGMSRDIYDLIEKTGELTTLQILDKLQAKGSPITMRQVRVATTNMKSKQSLFITKKTGEGYCFDVVVEPIVSRSQTDWHKTTMYEKITTLLEAKQPLTALEMRRQLRLLGLHKTTKQMSDALSFAKRKGLINRNGLQYTLRRPEQNALEFSSGSATPKPMQHITEVEKTPEKALIGQHESLNETVWRDVVLVTAIAAISAALTTIILEYL